MTPRQKFYSMVEIAAKTAIGLLPGYVSAAVNAIYDGIKSNVLNKRIEKWKIELVSRVENLETNFDDLVNNETFASSLIRATELAIKTESDEKRKLLANALVNTYTNSLDEDKIIIFFNLIEKYTTLHVQIIKYAHDEYMNDTFPNNIVTSYIALFKMRFNSVDTPYIEKALSDLKNDYVLVDFKNDAIFQPTKYRVKIITKLGDEFYNFLKSEIDGNNG